MIDIELLKRIKVVIDGDIVGIIPLEDEPSSTQSSSAHNSFLRSAISEGEYIQNNLDSLSNCDFDEKTYNDIGDRSAIWTKGDDETLCAAVNTLGQCSWERISKYWFNGLKFDFECEYRWEDIKDSNLDIPFKSGTKYLNSDNIGNKRPSQFDSSCNWSSLSANCCNDERKKETVQNLLKKSVNRNNTKPVSIRKRRELEALEERRLFGKDRSEVEKQLIHRAYIIGQTKLEKILRMNAAESKGENDTTISFSSIVTEMKKIPDKIFENSLKSTSKNIRKLPRSVMEIEEQDVYSPIKSEQYSKSVKPQFAHGHLLNLNSTQLPISQIIEVERYRISQIERDKSVGERIDGPILSTVSNNTDECSLKAFLSPPLNRPFPYLESTLSSSYQADHVMPRLLF